MNHMLRVMTALYFTNYLLNSFIVLVIYVVQIYYWPQIGITYTDQRVFNWFSFALGFMVITCLFYLGNMVITSRRVRGTHNQYICLLMSIFVVKFIFYSWAIDGLVLFFQSVRKERSQLKLEIMANGFIAMTVINIMDFMRLFACLLFSIVFHICCKVRAKRYRRRIESQNTELVNLTSSFQETHLRDVELYYRFLETRNLNNVGLLKKKFKVMRMEILHDKEDEHVCPICCD